MVIRQAEGNNGTESRNACNEIREFRMIQGIVRVRACTKAGGFRKWQPKSNDSLRGIQGRKTTEIRGEALEVEL